MASTLGESLPPSWDLETSLQGAFGFQGLGRAGGVGKMRAFLK